MNTVAQVAALVGALAYLGAAPMELFFFDRPGARRFLHVELGNAASVDETIGATVVVTSCAYMLLASLAMGLADGLGYWRPPGGSVVGTVASSLPPLVALVAAAA